MIASEGNATEIHAVRRAFQMLDLDRSGGIDVAEFQALLSQIDPEQFTPERVRRMLAAADADRDGVVSIREFAAWVLADEEGQEAVRQVGRAPDGGGGFEPRSVPGLRFEPASAEDAALTVRLVTHPTFSGAEGERGLEHVRTYNATARLGARDWRVNVAAAACPAEQASGRVALFMHGHGHSCCISTWGRLWAPMLARGFHLLAFDAPGFGRSEGVAGQTKPWREWDADLVLQLLRAFDAFGQGRVTVFGQCMGGAMFLRALQASPDTFAPWHVTHNCTIGTWPKQLPDILRAKGGGLQAFYWVDPDHLREANVYREFTSLMTKSPELCTFVDLQRDRDIPAFFNFGRVPEERLARAEDAVVLGYCEQAVDDLADYVCRPARRRQQGSAAPKKTMLELGRENRDFKVFVRVRPPLQREAGAAACCTVNDVQDPRGRQVQQLLVHDGAQAKGEFVFERIFSPDASQEDVWDALHGSLDPVGAILEGIGATVFAYGQTGSGKTYTIDGAESGLVGRIVRDLYDRLPPGHGVHCHYVQLYNEEFLDLFAPPAKVQQNSSGNIVGARVLEAASAQELLRSIRTGSTYRASGATNMNDASSRSHAILSLSITLADGGDAAADAQLFIVDLAGSERVKRSGVTGTQLAEAVAINQSLLALSHVTHALVENDGRPRAHIPYRDSALTQLLRNSLGGRARTALVACISPAADSADETLGTLRFAKCATHVQNRSEQAERAAIAQADQAELEAALAGNHVEFVHGEAVIATDAGGLHCYGDMSAGDGSPFVVLVHLYGRGCDASMWQGMFQPLRDAGCRYLAPDMPGHGSSPGVSSGSSDDHSREGGPISIILQLLDACGVQRAVLVGYDWGGSIACAFAVAHPMRTALLVAWAALLRDVKQMERLRKRGQKGDVLVLWAKNDQWHPYRKGVELATAMGVKPVEVKVKANGGMADVQRRVLEFIAAAA